MRKPAGLLLLLLLVLPGCGGTKLATWQACQHVFCLEVPQTAIQWNLGLGGRDAIPHQWGMVFRLPRPYQWKMWMKGMKAPIDMVFVRGGRVVRVLESLAPCPEVGPCELFDAGVVDYVVEVRAGTVAQLKLKVGDRVDLAL
ncbi:hypothetical protein D3C72_737280 [compost metagenome]